jgi:hypothetical protein
VSQSNLGLFCHYFPVLVYNGLMFIRDGVFMEWLRNFRDRAFGFIGGVIGGSIVGAIGTVVLPFYSSYQAFKVNSHTGFLAAAGWVALGVLGVGPILALAVIMTAVGAAVGAYAGIKHKSFEEGALVTYEMAKHAGNKKENGIGEYLRGLWNTNYKPSELGHFLEKEREKKLIKPAAAKPGENKAVIAVAATAGSVPRLGTVDGRVNTVRPGVGVGDIKADPHLPAKLMSSATPAVLTQPDSSVSVVIDTKAAAANADVDTKSSASLPPLPLRRSRNKSQTLTAQAASSSDPLISPAVAVSGSAIGLDVKSQSQSASKFFTEGESQRFIQAAFTNIRLAWQLESAQVGSFGNANSPIRVVRNIGVSGGAAAVVDSKLPSNDEFFIHKTKITTQKDDVDIFFGMLVAFHAVHGEAKLPTLTTYPAAMHNWKKALERACDQNLYKKEQVQTILQAAIKTNSDPLVQARQSVPVMAAATAAPAVTPIVIDDKSGSVPSSPRRT